MGVFASLLMLLACGGSDDAQAADMSSAPWTVYRPAVRDERWADARCNDGSPSSVAVRRSTSGSKTWVIRVQGGFYCDDDLLQCRDRPARFTTALADRGQVIEDGATWSGEGTGLFSTRPKVNPTFADANFALLWYCSSDLWLGRSTEKQSNTGAREGWYFSGRHVLRAGLEVLPLAGLDVDDPETRVLLVGQSSGGIGLASNLDAVSGSWPGLVERGAVKAVIDGAWMSPMPMDEVLRVNRWGPLLEACEADQRATGEDPLRCVFGREWLPYWDRAGIPVLVAQSGLDGALIKTLGVSGLGRAQFRDRVKADLEQVPHVVSGGFEYHLVAFDPKLGDTVFGRAFVEALDRFWTGGGPERVFHRYDEAP